MYFQWKKKVVLLKDGPELLPRCDNVGMHMPAVRLTKHRQNVIFEKAIYMQLRHRVVDMT